MASRKISPEIARNPCGIRTKEKLNTDESERKIKDIKANNWTSGKLHPLLVENVLDVLFKYLPKKDLLKCRTVCQMWDKSSRNHLKKFTPNSIQFVSESKGQTVAKFGKMFNSSIYTGQSNLFQSFTFTNFEILKSFGNFVSKYDEDQLNIREFALKLFPQWVKHLEMTSLNNLNYSLKFLTTISHSLESFEVEEFEHKMKYFNNKEKMFMEFPNLIKLSLQFKNSSVSFNQWPLSNDEIVPNYFFQQILGSTPKLSKLYITIQQKQNFNLGLYLGLNLSSIKNTLQELHISIKIDSYLKDRLSIFDQQDLNLKLKVFTFELEVHYLITLTQFTDILEDFERFLKSQADTLLDLKIDIKNQHSYMTVRPSIFILPYLPKLKKLGYIFQINMGNVSTNFGQYCPNLTHLETGQNTIDHTHDIFKTQLVSYKIILI